MADLAARGVDVAVIEVGLGGRLDSTNVITPLVSVVTKIAREHTDYLGTDLAAIAREKAGIAKPGVPFVTGERDPAVRQELAAEAGRRGAAPVIFADTTRPPPPARRLGSRPVRPGERTHAGVARSLSGYETQCTFRGPRIPPIDAPAEQGLRAEGTRCSSRAPGSRAAG